MIKFWGLFDPIPLFHQLFLWLFRNEGEGADCARNFFKTKVVSTFI